MRNHAFDRFIRIAALVLIGATAAIALGGCCCGGGGGGWGHGGGHGGWHGPVCRGGHGR